ncbi:MAG: LamG-like jellyroll fold domain-containing protein, partial [Kiritimatiellia bacterium]
MQLRKIAGVFFACVIAFSVRAATDESLLFYCNYDGSANATFSRGEGAAKCTVSPEFLPGVRGQAVVIGGNTSGVQTIVNDLPANTLQELNCCYAPDKNLDVHRGSVSFWVKPLDWDGNTKGFNVLFYTQAGQNFFQLYKFFSDDAFLFLRGDQKRGWTSVENKIRYWKTGEWHHVVAAWGQDELKMYIDGARVCSRKVRFPLENTSPVQPFSVGPGGAWKHAFVGRSLVDEFRIHDRPLSDDEVVGLYRQDSAAVEIDAGLATVGQKTPALDGTIKDGEYAFAGPGFNDLKGYLSPQQGFYYFSYDRSNLYIAVSSGLGAEKTAPAMERDGAFEVSERVEVYLAPDSAEKDLYRFVLTPSGGMNDDKNGEKQWSSAGLKLANGITNGSWIAELAIPFADLGLKEAPDSRRWRVNIGRVFVSPPAAVAIAPVKGALDDRSQFITLVFRPDAPLIRVASWTDLAKKQTAEDISVQSTNILAEIRLDRISDTTLAYGLKARASPLFSRGKATPQKSSVFAMSQDFILGETRIVEKVDGKETTLYARKTICENDDPMRTFFLYTQAKKQLLVSAWHKADGNIRARFLKPDGSCTFEASRPIPKDSAYFNALFDMDFEKLVPGLYLIKIDYVAPDGKALETWEQAISIPKPDDPMFKPYVDPEADKVPAPWIPLKSDNEKVAMWGREYDFSKGILFSSLKSQGEEILAAPVLLRMDGETLSPSGEVGLAKKAGTDMLAEWEKKADLGKLKVESRIKTHFDGYCEVAMTFSPAGKEQVIKSLVLDIPLRPEAATLVRDNRISFLDKSKSGAVTDGWHQDLTGSRNGPFIWVGNDRVGFNWLAPNLENWSCRKTERSVEIVRQGDASILRFNLADTPTNWAEGRTIKFGFILTPSRPLDQKIHRM